MTTTPTENNQTPAAGDTGGQQKEQQQQQQQHPVKKCRLVECARAATWLWEALTGVGTVALAIFAVLAWQAAGKQIEAANKQATAAIDQVQTANQQIAEMQADKRPWIGVSKIEAIGNPQWPTRNGDTMKFALAFYLKNSGRSPAVVHMKAELIPDTKDTVKVPGPLCEAAREEVRKNGWAPNWMVMPNDEWPHDLSDQDLPFHDSVARIRDIGGKYRPAVVGCVVYRWDNRVDLWSTAFVGLLSVEDQDRAKETPRDQPNPLYLSMDKPPPGKALRVKAISIVEVPTDRPDGGRD